MDIVRLNHAGLVFLGVSGLASDTGCPPVSTRLLDPVGETNLHSLLNSGIERVQLAVRQRRATPG